MQRFAVFAPKWIERDGQRVGVSFLCPIRSMWGRFTAQPRIEVACSPPPDATFDNLTIPDPIASDNGFVWRVHTGILTRENRHGV